MSLRACRNETASRRAKCPLVKALRAMRLLYGAASRRHGRARRHGRSGDNRTHRHHPGEYLPAMALAELGEENLGLFPDKIGASWP